MHGPPGTVRSASTWSPELLRPGKCTKHRTHFREHPCRAAWNLSNVDAAVSGGKPSVVQILRALPTHASGICSQCSSLPTAQLNK